MHAPSCRSLSAIRRARRASRGELGRLTVGYTSLIHYPFFRDALRLYRARYPGVEVILRDLVTIEQLRQLHTSTLDISFATYASFAITSLELERLAHECILREPVVAVVPTDHRLAGHGPIQLAALANEPWVWFAHPFDPTTYDYMTRLFEQAGFRPIVAQEVSPAQSTSARAIRWSRSRLSGGRTPPGALRCGPVRRRWRV